MAQFLWLQFREHAPICQQTDKSGRLHIPTIAERLSAKAQSIRLNNIGFEWERVVSSPAYGYTDSNGLERIPDIGRSKEKPIVVDGNPSAGASSQHKRRRVSSSYTDRLRNLPSASQMSQPIMHQQQGCLLYDFNLGQPFFKSVREPLYLNYRCEARQVPIRLLHPVFGRFAHLSESLTPDPSTLLLVKELCASARHYCGGDKHYQPVLEKLLQKFLNTTGSGTLHRVLVESSSYTTGTTLAGLWGLVMVCEFKDHLDELSQPKALRCYAQLWQGRFEAMHNHSFAASFILELVGCNLRIGGAVWGSRVQYEPLTDTMNLLPLWQQGPVFLRLARHLQALCLCVKDLLAEYNVQSPGISTERSRLYANGIPVELHDETRFANVQPFLQGRHAGLFSYTDAASGEARLAKFTQHYGISVHEAWASIGVAPRSPTAISLDCDMQLVTMELLSDEWQFLKKLATEIVQDTRTYVMAALQQAQQILLAVGVHGDLRQTNVAVKRGKKGWMVKFVDFDWSGPAGLHRFPPCMNSQIDRPDGVRPLAIMHPQHDVDLLARQF